MKLTQLQQGETKAITDLVGQEARKTVLKTLSKLCVTNILTKPEYDLKVELLERKCKEMPEEGMVVTYDSLMQ